MQKIGGNNSISKRQLIVAMLYFIAIAYYAGVVFWIMRTPEAETNIIDYIYIHVNPFTYGAYFLGVTMLVVRKLWSNSITLVLICFAYMSTVVLSLVSIMGMTGWKDAIVFLPHLIIGIAYIITAFKRNNE